MSNSPAVPASGRTFLDAAVAVLRGANGPLTSREITERALRARLLVTAGKTPWKTMDAALYASNAVGGSIERFAREGAVRAVRGNVRWRLRDPGAEWLLRLHGRRGRPARQLGQVGMPRRRSRSRRGSDGRQEIRGGRRGGAAPALAGRAQPASVGAELWHARNRVDRIVAVALGEFAGRGSRESCAVAQGSLRLKVAHYRAQIACPPSRLGDNRGALASKRASTR
jgi:hypothetical protein